MAIPFVLGEKGHLIYKSPKFTKIVQKYSDSLQDVKNNSSFLSHHVTLISPKDNLVLTEKVIEDYFLQNPENEHYFDLGLGRDEKSGFSFVVIHFPYGDQFRKHFKLKSVNFFIPVSNSVPVPSGFWNPSITDSQLEFKQSQLFGQFVIEHSSPFRCKQIEYLELALENFDGDRRVIIELSKLYPKTSEGAEEVLRLSSRLLEINDIAGFYMKIKILQIVGETSSFILQVISKSLLEFRIPILNEITDTELKQEQDKHIKFVLTFLNETCNEGETKFKYYYCEWTSEFGQFVKYQMPRNFGWVRPHLTAGSSEPKLDDITIFEKMGIKHIITCLEQPLPISLPKQTGIKIHFFEIEDRTPPTFDQIDKILAIIGSGEPTVVHCKGGVGRTNTVLACDLIQNENLNSQESITKIKAIRPKVILDDSQVKFIREFSNRKYCTKPVKLPKIFMFVGYPASGKSTLSQHICNYLGEESTVRINQDEMGRKKCWDEFNDHIKSDKTIIIDCCNLTKEKRAEWQQMSFRAVTWVIFMDLPIEECKYRIVRRINHPTVKNGLRILQSLDNTLEIPNESEGFDKIVRIQRDTEIDLLLKDLGINQPLNVEVVDRIIKFPRTRHLINLGSATRDDLLFAPDEQHEFSKQELEVEEKVDGANLGIIVKNDYKIQVQNRSHYVSSSYHPQFKLLDKWVLQHTEELLQILEPENEILYGEWLYMKHSIHYTELDDYFYAFDLYNITTQTFLSREELMRRLENTSVQQVPLIVKKTFGSTSEIVDILKRKSAFYDGLIEGVYLRVSKDGVTTDRAKVVRQDFICGAGNDGGNTNVRHWTKHKLTANVLKINRVV